MYMYVTMYIVPPLVILSLPALRLAVVPQWIAAPSYCLPWRLSPWSCRQPRLQISKEPLQALWDRGWFCRGDTWRYRGGINWWEEEPTQYCFVRKRKAIGRKRETIDRLQESDSGTAIVCGVCICVVGSPCTVTGKLLLIDCNWGNIVNRRKSINWV